MSIQNGVASTFEQGECSNLAALYDEFFMKPKPARSGKENLPAQYYKSAHAVKLLMHRKFAFSIDYQDEQPMPRATNFFFGRDDCGTEEYLRKLAMHFNLLTAKQRSDLNEIAGILLEDRKQAHIAAA